MLFEHITPSRCTLKEVLYNFLTKQSTFFAKLRKFHKNLFATYPKAKTSDSME